MLTSNIDTNCTNVQAKIHIRFVCSLSQAKHMLIANDDRRGDSVFNDVRASDEKSEVLCRHICTGLDKGPKMSHETLASGETFLEDAPRCILQENSSTSPWW